MRNIYYRETSSWSLLPLMQRARGSCFAGLVTYPDGSKGILAAGGYDIISTEFLNLDTMTWEYKKDLPIPNGYGRSVPYKESFLIVTGWNTADGYLNTIYYYNPAADNWDMLPRTVNTGGAFFEAYLLPPDYEDCL